MVSPGQRYGEGNRGVVVPRRIEDKENIFEAIHGEFFSARNVARYSRILIGR